MTPDRCDRLAVLVTEQPDATLAELRDRLGAAVHLSTVARALARLRPAGKKKVRRAAEQDRPDVRHKRATFRGRAAGIDPGRWVFLDETGVNTAMARLYGRAPRGERVVGKVPQGHWQMTTLVAGIRADGVVAPFALDRRRWTGRRSRRTWSRCWCRACGRGTWWSSTGCRRTGAGRWPGRSAGPGRGVVPAPVLAGPQPDRARLVEGGRGDAGGGGADPGGAWGRCGEAVGAITAQDRRHSFARCGYHATPMCKCGT